MNCTRELGPVNALQEGPRGGCESLDPHLNYSSALAPRLNPIGPVMDVFCFFPMRSDVPSQEPGRSPLKRQKKTHASRGVSYYPPPPPPPVSRGGGSYFGRPRFCKQRSLLELVSCIGDGAPICRSTSKAKKDLHETLSAASLTQETSEPYDTNICLSNQNSTKVRVRVHTDVGLDSGTRPERRAGSTVLTSLKYSAAVFGCNLKVNLSDQRQSTVSPRDD